MRTIHPYNRNLAAAIVLLVIAVFIVISFSIYQSGKVNASAKLLYHTQDVILHTEILMTYTIDRTKNVKEYLLTGDMRVIQKKDSLSRQMIAETEVIKALTKDNPLQQQRIDSITLLIKKRNAVLDELFYNYNKQNEQATILVKKVENSDAVVNETRSYIEAMQQTEIELLESRKQLNEERVKNLGYVFVAAILLILALFFFIFRKIASEIRQKRQLAEALEKSNIELEKQVAEGSVQLSTYKHSLVETLENMTEGYIELDRNWRYTYVNKRIEEMTFHNAEQMLGKNIWEEFPEAVDSETYKVFHDVMENGGYQVQIDYLASADLWYESHVYSSSTGIFVFIRNITKKKKIELELQANLQSLKDYQFAVDQASIVSITDKDGVLNYVNENYCKASGYSSKELLGVNVFSINPEFLGSATGSEMLQTVQSGKVWKGERISSGKSGRVYWLYSTIIPFLDKEQQPYQYLTISFDITEKKLAEEKVINTLTENNIILESIDDAFYALNKNWIITYCNSFAEKLFRKPKHEVIGKSILEVIPEVVDSPFYKYFIDASAGKSIRNVEEYSHRMGNWYNLTVYPYETGFALYFKDVSFRKQSELELLALNQSLTKQKEELTASNKELEQFAYVASHDLQEPLRMITSYLTAIEKKYRELLDDRGKRYIDFAVDGGRRMRQIILDLLDFSRVGRTDDKLEEVDVALLLEEIKILYSTLIAEKNATLLIGKMPLLTAYKAPLRQVFQNLVNNALKYSSRQEPVQISISANDTETHWQFEVKDNGIGIDEEFFGRIFVLFQRLHIREEYAGNGIGLAIAKKIVQNMGGEIWVASEEGKGATFYFTISKNINK